MGEGRLRGHFHPPPEEGGGDLVRGDAQPPLICPRAKTRCRRCSGMGAIPRAEKGGNPAAIALPGPDTARTRCPRLRWVGLKKTTIPPLPGSGDRPQPLAGRAWAPRGRLPRSVPILRHPPGASSPPAPRMRGCGIRLSLTAASAAHARPAFPAPPRQGPPPAQPAPKMEAPPVPIGCPAQERLLALEIRAVFSEGGEAALQPFSSAASSSPQPARAPVRLTHQQPPQETSHTVRPV